jgi:hypothetical protein
MSANSSAISKNLEKRPVQRPVFNRKSPKKTSSHAAVSSGSRDAHGRFLPGVSGNPVGRAILSEELKEYGKWSTGQMWDIAQNEATSVKLKVEICKWFAEMAYGKPRQSQNIDANINGQILKVEFQGELEEWSR